MSETDQAVAALPFSFQSIESFNYFVGLLAIVELGPGGYSTGRSPSIVVIFSVPVRSLTFEQLRRRIREVGGSDGGCCVNKEGTWAAIN